MWTWAPTLPEGKQPEMLTTEAIRALLKQQIRVSAAGSTSRLFKL
jgi:hypothetical protein